MKSVVVVGGAGYIGSVIAELLVEKGYRVTVYDNLSAGHRKAVPTEAAFVQGDLGDAASLRQTLEQSRADAVMHFAALANVPDCTADPQRCFANNVGNVIGLLNLMKDLDIKRFVFSSSAAIYGEPESVPISETAPHRPTSAYGESKLMVERALAWYDRLLGLRYASLRYFNAAGASVARGEDHRPETHLIPLVLDVARGSRSHIEVFGTDYPTVDGTCLRDYIHVVDLAEAHILALEALDGGSRVYNLGNGRGYTVRQVIEAARKVTGCPVKVVEGPRRAGDTAALVADSAKAKRELGWNPRFPDLESIVGSAWEWHERHPNGYGE